MSALLRNESSIDTDKLASLTTFVLDRFGATLARRVEIVVRDAKHGSVSGFAYRHIGSKARGSSRDYLVHIDIGAITNYPIDNLRWTSRSLPKGSTRDDAERIRDKHIDKGYVSQVRTIDYMRNGEVQYTRFLVATKHPYGGMSSPLILNHDLDEVIVSIIAHEVTHIEQFATERKASEVECERRSLEILNAFRSARA